MQRHFNWVSGARVAKIARFGLPILAACVLTGCYATTSGSDIYQPPAPPLNTPTMTEVIAAAAPQAQGIDREVAALFAVRPRLQIPARFALVRVESGRLKAPTPEEMTHWVDLSARLGPGFGQFVALDPMMADLAVEAVTQAKSTAATPGAPLQRNAMNDLRRGAALIKADYAIVYEVATQTEDKANLLSMTDWTIIGLWIAPSRDVKAEALAQAALIDVRTGLPLGSASAQAESDGLARASTSFEQAQERADIARVQAVKKLTVEVEAMAATLQREANADRRSIAD
jgi:hypothetical protein